MKKLISTIAALGVVVAMGATAMAADLPSPTTGTDITATLKSLDGDYYDVTVSEVDFSIPADVIDGLMDEVAESAGDKEVAAIDLCTIEITNKETGADMWYYIDEDNPATVAFAFDGANNVIAVLEYDEFTGSWVSIDFEIVDGEVVANLQEAWLISFVTEAVKADEPAKEDGKGSAQTGYDSLVYVVSAVALAAGAVFFFVSSKKSATEVM